VTNEYGVSLFGVTTAVSFRVETRAVLYRWFGGALYCGDALSTAYW
jgi:hypothetical protein